MAESRAEILRRTFDAWNARDMDAYVAAWAEDGVFVPPPGWPEPGPFRGRHAIRAAFEDYWRSLSESHIEWDDPLDVAGASVMPWRLHAAGSQSGITGTIDLVAVMWWRDEQWVRVEQHESMDEAMAAARRGLEEPR